MKLVGARWGPSSGPPGTTTYLVRVCEAAGERWFDTALRARLAAKPGSDLVGWRRRFEARAVSLAARARSAS